MVKGVTAAAEPASRHEGGENVACVEGEGGVDVKNLLTDSRVIT